MPRRIYTPYRRKTDPELKKQIDRIIRDLERHRLSISRSSYASTLFAKRFIAERDKGHIYIGQDGRHKKTIITLAPNVKIKRLKNGNVELVFDPI